MKQIVLYTFLFTLTNSMYSQFSGNHLPWGVYVYKKDPLTGKYEGFPNHTAYVGMTYKNDAGEIKYKENFATELNELSFLQIELSSGTTDPTSPGQFYEPYDYYKKICYTIQIDMGAQGSETVMGEHLIGDSPYAVLSDESEHANNADALGNNQWVGEEIDEWDEVSIPLTNLTMLISDDTSAKGKFDLLPVDNFLGKASAPSAVNQTELAYYQVGTGEGVPVVFSQNPVLELEGFLTNCFESDENLFNGAVFKYNQGNRPPLTHSTAAVYGENIYDPLGVGVFANGASRGSYNQGQTGMLGLTIGTGNGAASWSRVAVAPAAGGFKYGVFAEDQGLAGSWAAAIFGNGFYTGTWSQSSDSRLKTEIRAQSKGLDKVMQMRPAQYRYIQNTPYGLPDGIHHGFIAQEMEEVLPELVSNITMPNNMNPDELAKSETSEYKAINYIELIPILTSAIQELHVTMTVMNTKIEAQALEIEKLKIELGKANKPK